MAGVKSWSLIYALKSNAKTRIVLLNILHMLIQILFLNDLLIINKHRLQAVKHHLIIMSKSLNCLWGLRYSENVRPASLSLGLQTEGDTWMVVITRYTEAAATKVLLCSTFSRTI